MQRRTGLDENANTAICTFHFFCAREDGERWASRRAEGGVGFRGTVGALKHWATVSSIALSFTR
jgi:hypothetical protein